MFVKIVIIIGIIQSRIEEFKPPIRANYITSRALAPLEKLLLYSVPLLMPDFLYHVLRSPNVFAKIPPRNTLCDGFRTGIFRNPISAKQHGHIKVKVRIRSTFNR